MTPIHFSTKFFFRFRAYGNFCDESNVIIDVNAIVTCML